MAKIIRFRTSDKGDFLVFSVPNVPNIWHLAHLAHLCRCCQKQEYKFYNVEFVLCYFIFILSPNANVKLHHV